MLPLLACTALLAQDPPPVEVSPPEYVPLTLGQSYSWTMHKVYSPGKLFSVAAGAAFDRSDAHPAHWGQGSEAYAARVASRWATIAVRENLAFGIRAVDHEDPRYFRSNESGIWNRTRYAITRTFIVRNEQGGTMPAYSTLLSSFATPYIAQTWHSESIRPGRELPTACLGIGVAALGNVGREFWPDIKKKLRR